MCKLGAYAFPRSGGFDRGGGEGTSATWGQEIFPRSATSPYGMKSPKREFITVNAFDRECIETIEKLVWRYVKRFVGSAQLSSAAAVWPRVCLLQARPSAKAADCCPLPCSPCPVSGSRRCARAARNP